MESVWMGWIKYESGSQGYSCMGDRGRAYGAYQFDYRYALVPFLKRCVQAGFSEFSKYANYRQGNPLLVANDNLKSLFVKYAKDKKFRDLQDEMAMEEYYKPAANYLKSKYGIDAEKHSAAFRGSLFSMSIRSGQQNGASRMNQKGTEEQILRKAYATYGDNDAKRWRESGQLGDALKALSEETKVGYSIDKVIEVAESQVGYMEKRSNAYLDDFTKNAGSGNFTKYARDVYPSLQGQAWCDMFVDWCFIKAYGESAAKKLLGGFSAYTPTSAQYFKNRNEWHKSNPKRGDVIFFKNDTRICHTGIVYRVANSTVYTIEGNTSNGSAVIPNGGQVCKKSYALSNSRIAGYGRPAYGEQKSSKPTDTNAAGTTTIMTKVKEGQKWLNDYYRDTLIKYLGSDLAVDGVYGAKTRAACVCVWKDLANRKYGASLSPSNSNFLDSCKAVAKKIVIEKGMNGTYPMLIQIVLAAKGFYTGAMDADFGSGTESAVKAFQKSKGLSQDGVVGSETWYRLFN